MNSLKKPFIIPLSLSIMAKTLAKTIAVFYNRHKKTSIFGLTILVLGIFALFSSSKPGPNPVKTKTKEYVSPSDGVICQNCKSCPKNPNMQHDPVKTTFYDDPSLSYSIDDPIFDWDEKRQEWLKQHPSFAEGAKDRIILVTGSQPSACTGPKGDHYLLRLFKNKVDYCRIHGYDVFYSNAFLHPEMNSYWSKMPLIRAAMMAHPEAEWIYWVDSDAVFTDMEFKLPLRRYEDYNFVVHSWTKMLEKQRSWCTANSGVFLLRNCQWSMDFLDVWANMGPMSPDVEKWGKLERETLPDKSLDWSDDQSAMIYLLIKQKEKWGDKVFIETEYSFQGYWYGLTDKYDNISAAYTELERSVHSLRKRHAEKEIEIYARVREPYLTKWGYSGKDSFRRPFITHFTGCQPCSGNHNPDYKGDSCTVGLESALNFADNQVLRRYGYYRPDIKDFHRVSPVPFDFPA